MTEPHERARGLPHSVPSPTPSPSADAAPDLLVGFLYHLSRDLLPPRYMETVLAHLSAHPNSSRDVHLEAYARELAKRLVYTPPTSG